MSDSDLPLFRRTDPATSQIAGEDVKPKLNGLRKQFVDRCRHWEECFGNWGTANEISQGNESLRKRAAECVELGYLKAGPVKHCSVTGKLARTFIVV